MLLKDGDKQTRIDYLVEDTLHLRSGQDGGIDTSTCYAMLIYHAALPLLIAKTHLCQNQRVSCITAETFTILYTSSNSITVLEYSCGLLTEYNKVAIGAKSLSRAVFCPPPPGKVR